MPKIITVTDLQKNIGKLAQFVGNSWAVVTSRGKASVIMLPYFDNNDEAVEEYLEDYEMHCNASVLKKRYQESASSGRSDLVI